MKGDESLSESESSMIPPDKISEMKMTRIILKIIIAAINYSIASYLLLLLFIDVLSSQRNRVEVLCYFMKSIFGVCLVI